jgi:hypothetical protein
MTITSEQYHRAKYDLKQKHKEAGGDFCVRKWEIQIYYPGMITLRIYFMDGVIRETSLDYYMMKYPREVKNETNNT